MDIRHNWTCEEVEILFQLPFSELLFQSHTIHRKYFDPNAVQIATLLNIKTGACPEDCSYCSQSARYQTDLDKEKLWPLDAVLLAAKKAKKNGASRFCMGAAWRGLHDRDLPAVVEMIKEVKALGLETCVTLGMLQEGQAEKLQEAGLDYYNHNLDTSPEYYKEIISTRSYEDRLNTLEQVRNAGINVCCGGIIGMGETREDRVGLLVQLANLPEHPKSVPINMLIKVKGTPMENQEDLDHLEFVRTIAIARMMMPQSFVRLSAGRESMSDETQALCFFAGANSIFYGEKLLTASNNKTNDDLALFERLGIKPLEVNELGSC